MEGDATKAESNGCEVNSPTGLKPAPRTSEAHRGKQRQEYRNTGIQMYGSTWCIEWLLRLCVCAMLQAGQVICLVYFDMIIIYTMARSTTWAAWGVGDGDDQLDPKVVIHQQFTFRRCDC